METSSITKGHPQEKKKGSRMTMAREALKLFLQSLPIGSHYKIISFGGHHTSLKIQDGITTIEYNDQNLR